jgi:hypothetical protein
VSERVPSGGRPAHAPDPDHDPTDVDDREVDLDDPTEPDPPVEEVDDVPVPDDAPNA